jgi:hypothetical protein
MPTGQALGTASDKIVGEFETAIRKIEHDLFTTVDRRFGELQGRLDGLMSLERPRPKDFKFAGERERDDGPLDLPNPLTPPRRRVLDS